MHSLPFSLQESELDCQPLIGILWILYAALGTWIISVDCMGPENNGDCIYFLCVTPAQPPFSNGNISFLEPLSLFHEPSNSLTSTVLPKTGSLQLLLYTMNLKWPLKQLMQLWYDRLTIDRQYYFLLTHKVPVL